MVEDASIMVYQQVARQEEEGIYFDLNQLRKLPNYNSYLYQWLHEFGSLLGMIFMIGESQSGKYVFLLSFDY
jgi:tRNA(Ile)-lysidine synthase